MSFIAQALGNILLFGLQVYFWIIIVSVVISWLVAFEVINVKNQQAQNLLNLLNKVTEPVYKPLRKYIPPIAGIDVTPIVIIFGIYLLERLVITIFF